MRVSLERVVNTVSPMLMPTVSPAHWAGFGSLVSTGNASCRRPPDMRPGLPDGGAWRVSRRGRQDDLERRVAAMAADGLGAGVAVDEWLSDIGDGLDCRCPMFPDLMD